MILTRLISNQRFISGSENIDEDELRDDLFNPYWIEDKDLRKSKFEVLNSQEITFWRQLIKNYLRPLVEDKNKQARLIEISVFENFFKHLGQILGA